MNLKENEILWNKIQQFAFDEPNATITFSKKLASQQKWSASYTQRVIEEYRRFIFLCCISPNGASPSKAVDEAWHLHLTYTKSYWDAFCKNTLGKDIHHYPSTGGEKEDHKHLNWYDETLSLYESVFGEQPPADIWPRPLKQVQTAGPSWEDVQQHFFVSKNVLLIVALLLLLPLSISYVITGIASPFLLTGKQFLLFYAIFCVATLISHYLLRKDRFRRTKKMLDAWTVSEANIFQLTHSVYGKERALQTCVVDLYRRNLVSVNNDAGKIVVHNANYQAPEKEENPLVPLVLAEPDGNSVSYATISDDWYTLQSFEHPSIKQLNELTGIKEPRFQRNIAVIIALIVGFARILQGWLNNRPVVFLFLEILAMVIISVIIASYFVTFDPVKNKLKQLLHDKAGSNQLHADEVVNDYALNGQRVLSWLPETMMLGSMFMLFPPPPRPSGDSGSGDPGSSCSSGSSGSSCSGGGCGGCGGGGD